MHPTTPPPSSTVDESTTPLQPAPQTVRKPPEAGIPSVIVHPEDSALPACPVEDRRGTPRD